MAASCVRAAAGLLRILFAVLASSPHVIASCDPLAACEHLGNSSPDCDATIAPSLLQAHGKKRSGKLAAASANGGIGGAEWSKEETLIVMAKLHQIFKSPLRAKASLERANGPFDCYTGYEQDGMKDCYEVAEDQFRDPSEEAVPKAHLLPVPAKFIRLAFHDCLKYTDGSGGCDGCMRFYDQFMQYKDFESREFPEMRYDDALRGTNNGLAMAADILELIYTRTSWPPRTPVLDISLKDSGKSRADLWSFAALVATDWAMAENNKACRGDGACAHIYTADEPPFNCSIEPVRWLRFFTGRSDCPAEDKPDAAGGRAKTMFLEPVAGHRYRDYETAKDELLPNPSGNYHTTMDFFKEVFGFNGKETVAIMGAHSLGSKHGPNTLWNYYWQEKQAHMMNNNYYRILINLPSSYIGTCHPLRVTRGPNGTTAEVMWEVRPLKTTVSAGPYSWFHSYRRCPFCRQLPDGEWVNEEAEGTVVQKADECCTCHYMPEHEVPAECIMDVAKKETMLPTDMSLYHKFDVDEYGIPSGCPGFPAEWERSKLVQQASGEADHGLDFTHLRPLCPENDLPSGVEGVTMADSVRFYANHQNEWALDFYDAWEKILANGHEDLTRGPDVLGIERCDCPGDLTYTDTCIKLD